MRLGTLITLLEDRPPNGHVSFDFGGLCPGNFSCWRMAYAELALTHDGKWPVETGKLLTMCRGADGHTFEGWKGGEFTMSAANEVWVANEGDPGGYTKIVGVIDDEDDTILATVSGLKPW